GKRNHFPINGQRAHSPADALDAENPLMLNPYKDHPEEHLSFPPGIISPERELVCIGTVEGTSPVGAQTIVICNLRRPQLCEERKKEQERFVNDLLLAMNRLDTAKIVSIWYDVLRGIRPYSAAVLAQSEVLGQMGIVCPQEARELAAATLACSDS
ncbi:MAG: hypothetical protein KKA73_07210, partial [Chloroflexi bacterium]|nr:hypothetical protein [Chloroflexota bacterium]